MYKKFIHADDEILQFITGRMTALWQHIWRRVHVFVTKYDVPKIKKNQNDALIAQMIVNYYYLVKESILIFCSLDSFEKVT